MSLIKVSAKAPASIGNVAVGFDILGLCLNQIFDKVHLTKRNDKEIHISEISGVITDLPKSIQSNTCTVALLKMQQDLGFQFGFDVHIEKGIPLASGLGGSAASAVAAVVAANEFLDQKLQKKDLLKYALAGESVASGSMHADNVAPSLFGGLCLCLKDNKVVQIPFPPEIYCILFHPDVKVETKSARKILSENISLKQFVEQSQNLAGFMSSCYDSDLDRMSTCLEDLVIEPQRAGLIPHFYDFKKAVIKLPDIIGFSISGAGPSLFALSKNKESANQISETFLKLSDEFKISGQSWVLKPNPLGASVDAVL